jgi:hypothetical protein
MECISLLLYSSRKLDGIKRPAAAVIPAPIAYIKVVAVKKLVVGFRGSQAVLGFGSASACCSYLLSAATVWCPARLL